MAENAVRTNRGNEELSFFARAIREDRKKSKKAAPDVVSIKPKSLEFGLPSF